MSEFVLVIFYLGMSFDLILFVTRNQPINYKFYIDLSSEVALKINNFVL